jgi:dienelactone hydrolase
VMLSCAVVVGQEPPPNTPNPGADGRRFLDLLLAGKYAEFHQACSPKLQERLTETVLSTKVGPVLAGFGKVLKIGDPKVSIGGSNRLVYITVTYEKAALNFKVAIDDQRKVDDINFQKIEQAVAKYVAPAYVKAGSFEERAVTFGLPDWQLPGTLTVPKGAGPFPGVVLVHGSGPNDRDETIGPNRPFRDLAEGLSSNGIAVLRYEKRSRQHAGRVAADRDLTVKEEVVDDAVAAAEFLRGQAGIDPKRVFVLGHSLGGYLGPRIAAQDGKLAGLILLAATARSLEDVVDDQMDYIASLPGQPDDVKTRAAAIKEQTAKARQADPPKDLVVLGMPIHYLADLHGYDPAAEAAKLSSPILVLQGERDYQATMKDFALWSKALEGHKNATLKSYPALNHLFAPGQGKAIPAEYEKENHVSADVVTDLAKWVAAH